MAQRRSVRLDRGAEEARPSDGRVPGQRGAPAGSGTGNTATGCVAILLLLLAILAAGRCSSSSPVPVTEVPTASVSEPAVVSARSLKCRLRPDTAATVAEGLRRGEQVVVAERSGDWARLTRAGRDCWVYGSFLSSASAQGLLGAGDGGAARSSGALNTSTAAASAALAGGYVATKVKASKKRAGVGRGRGRGRGSQRRRGSSGRGAYFGSGCPCSGAQVCIGPRGGRYCITSGGNKRYGV